MTLVKYFEKIILIIIGLSLGWGVAVGVGAYAGNELNDDPSKIKEIYNHSEEKPERVDFSTFWQVWQIMENKHVDSAETEKLPSAEERVWGAIQGMINAYGDPYSVFMPPEDRKQFDENISGEFGGVGMEIGMEDGVLTVISPLANTPAEKAGIKAGDKIIKVNEETTENMTVEDAVKKIRGEKGTSVNLTIIRGSGEEKEFKVTREKITVPTLETEIKDGIFIIRLFTFSEPSTDLFRKALRGFAQSEAEDLIIDLRGNPGGFLRAAVDMTSWFLPAGEVVVREVRADESGKTFRSRGYDLIKDDINVAVLVNRGSASGSEILAGALQDHNRATLIGEQTFGKGSVQEVTPIDSNSSLKITVARWLTPKGTSISDNGLTPDIEVKMSQDELAQGEDPQLKKAIKYLSEKE